ncbi:MAG: heme-binding protein, partial [Candidatus Thermoplasmatota archaeon]|nr:heme-binding protein [Candidatus Thermoplasmatota archaeon]
MSENLEEPGFEVIEICDGFEIRKYVDTIQARVVTKGTGYHNSTGAFRRIASYIFGRNDQSQNIAMTAPVHMWES